ncbi:MAG TPA: hypothetical protein VKV23_04995 [Acidimicrobiales bacterium]|nr:hypothetical protein [Acidimicrobiales bacterium]
MTQPKFAPILVEDEVRPTTRLAPPRPWTFHRPAEVLPARPPWRRGGGVPGPDQGYALRLARRLEDRLVLEPGEHREDVVAGIVAIAMRRAARAGRAPVLADLELAAELFGFLSDAPSDLVEHRRAAFAGVAHDYGRRRELAASVPEESLALTPETARAKLAAWRELLGA